MKMRNPQNKVTEGQSDCLLMQERSVSAPSAQGRCDASGHAAQGAQATGQPLTP